ncbi:MAG: AbrB/MazE/SpoVT family DNA-binding domain-containing protein [Rhodospirillales bacterium]|nr:MAG: AbrB/MazE/SpoVT family DNA-binding domain-containing protein [Rhodospirillales bacterium]
MNSHRRVKLVKIGSSQFIPIPDGYELPGEDATIRKEGDRLLIEPAPRRSLLAVLATLGPLEEAFPPIPELPVDPVKL